MSLTKTQQRKLALENIERLKAHKNQPKPPIEGVRLEGHLHHLKPELLGVSLLDLTNTTAPENAAGAQHELSQNKQRFNRIA